MSGASGAYESLLDDLLRMHKGRVNAVHPPTHHDAKRRRNLFSGCSCGWLGQGRISDAYDETVPMPCPTVLKIEGFRTSRSADSGTPDGVA